MNRSDHQECYGACLWGCWSCPGTKEVVLSAQDLAARQPSEMPKRVAIIGEFKPAINERLRSICHGCGFHWTWGEYWETTHWNHYMSDKAEFCFGPIVSYCEIE